MIHILRRESLAVAQIQQPVIRPARPASSLMAVLATTIFSSFVPAMKQRRQIQRERRMPHRSRQLSVDINQRQHRAPAGRYQVRIPAR